MIDTNIYILKLKTNTGELYRVINFDDVYEIGYYRTIDNRIYYYVKSHNCEKFNSNGINPNDESSSEYLKAWKELLIKYRKYIKERFHE